MHREMIAAVNKKGDGTYPKVECWPPAQPTRTGRSRSSTVGRRRDRHRVQVRRILRRANDGLDARQTDPATLRKMPLGELGWRVEFTIHNRMQIHNRVHMRWSAKSGRVRSDVDPAASEAIDNS
jgi:hypothetical protein